jgi:predicted transcriptional regulator
MSTSLPTIHLPVIDTLSGTNRTDLLADYLKAKTALKKAVEDLSATWPHPRDYPEHGTFYAAQREHTARIMAVNSVLSEISIIAESIV